MQFNSLLVLTRSILVRIACVQGTVRTGLLNYSQHGDFYGFWKSVVPGDSTTPTTNHMFIIPGDTGGFNQTYAADSDFDGVFQTNTSLGGAYQVRV